MPHVPAPRLAVLVSLALAATLTACGGHGKSGGSSSSSRSPSSPGSSSSASSSSAAVMAYVKKVDQIGDTIESTVQTLQGDPSSSSSASHAQGAIDTFEGALVAAQKQLGALSPPAGAGSLNATLLTVISRENHEVHAAVARVTSTSDSRRQEDDIAKFLRESKANSTQIAQTLVAIDLRLGAHP